MNNWNLNIRMRVMAAIVALVMVITLSSSTVAVHANTAYDFQPDIPEGENMNSMKMLDPSDITVVEENDTYILNHINTVVDGTQDIKFTMTMSAGMNNFSESNFLKNNMPIIKIYDEDGDIAAEYSEGAGDLQFLGSLRTDEINNQGSNKTSELYLGVEQGVLGTGDYMIEFGRNLCGNNTSKILGKDIRFKFTVKATADLDIMISEARVILDDAVIGNESGQYPQTAADRLQAAITEADNELKSVESDLQAGVIDEKTASSRKNAAAEILASAVKEFENSRIVSIEKITITGIGEKQCPGDNGTVNAEVTVVPDKDSYKKVTWESSDNIRIDAVSGSWIALYSGKGWVRAVSKADPTVSEDFPVEVVDEDGVTGVVLCDKNTAVIDAIKIACSNDISNIAELKLYSAGTGTVTKTDTNAIRNNMPALKTLDLKNVSIEEIGSNWFEGWSTIEKIVLPEQLKLIGVKSFYNCSGLKDITFPASLENIGASAFAGCTALNKTMTVMSANPPSVATAIFESQGFGDSFEGISSDSAAGITTIKVPYGCKADFDAADGWKRYKIVEMEAKHLTVSFDCSGGLASAAEMTLEAKGWDDDEVTFLNVVSSNGVVLDKTTDIAYLQKNFLGATIVDLSGTAFPDNNIQASTFEDRKNAKEIILPEGVTHMGRKAFYGCANLRILTVPSTVTYVSASNPGIGESTLAGCPKLTTLIMNPAEPPGYLGSLPSNLESIYVPNLCVVDYKEAFSDQRDIIKPQSAVFVSDVSVEAMKAVQLKATVDSVVPMSDDLKWEITTSQDASNPVAVINKDTGVLTACRYGTVKVKVTAGYGTMNECTATATVTVTKAPAVTLTAARASFNSIKLSWSQMSGAEGYQIFRSTSKDGTYSNIKTVTAGTTSYTNTGLTTGKTYYYKVRGYKAINGVKVYTEYSAVKSAKPYLTTPTVTAKRYSFNSNKISWNGISGATGYKIYRSTSKSGKYSLIATKGSDVRSYVDKSRTTGKTYYYKVRAYRTIDKNPVYSSYSSIKSAKPYLSTVTGVKATKGGTKKIKVTWKKVSGASGYTVYRSAKKTSGFKAVKTVKGNSTVKYTTGKLTKGKTYYFKVKAYRTVNGKKVYSPNYSSVVKYKVK